jgi:hypothetical protein
MEGRIDVAAADAALRAKQPPFEGDPRWSVSKRREMTIFRTALVNFAWQLELVDSVVPIHTVDRKVWLEISVDAEGNVQEPAVHSSKYAGELEDDDEFIDVIREEAYRAYATLQDTFYRDYDEPDDE